MVEDENVPNAYPELPVIPFARTTLKMGDFIAYLSEKKTSVAVKCAAYVIFRNESGAGQKGINNNYIGLQADGGRQAPNWTSLFAGTCVHRENMTGKPRRFLCFKDWHGCIDILASKVKSRGLYVGGFAHPYANMEIPTIEDWPLAYTREWVQGDPKAEVSETAKANLLSQYRYAARQFPSDRRVA